MDRIDLLASLAKNSNCVLDVGCDHAFVLIKAIKKYGCKSGIASDINDGPLKCAYDNISHNNLLDKIEIVKSDGLKNINSNFDTLIIAGMGGNLIKDILSNGMSKLDNQLLILEPNNDKYCVRKFLMDNGFKIIDEYAIFDTSKYYEIIIAKKGLASYSDFELKYGPTLILKKENDFLNFYKNKAKMLEDVLKKVSNEEIKKQKLNELLEIKKYILDENV